MREDKTNVARDVDVVDDAFDVEFIDATLYPGDALYIPPGWWHRVKAATVSFSVSYWWD